MRNFIKAFSFLLLMLVLGFSALLLHYGGHLFGVHVYNDGENFLLLSAYIANLLLVAIVVIGVFYAYRKYLFGRGKPWLAGFSIIVWLAVWSVVAYSDMKKSNIVTTPIFFLGEKRLVAHMESMRELPATLEELTRVTTESPKDLDELCEVFIKLPKLTRIKSKIQRDGMPLRATVTRDIFDKLISKKPCDSKVLDKIYGEITFAAMANLLSGNYAESADNFEILAKRGDAKAQYKLAEIYLDGRDGVPANVKNGLFWLEKAVAGNDDEAQNLLAVAYFDGRYGFSVNAEKAVNLFEKAVLQNNSSAQNNLGTMYWYGSGIQKNETKAIELLKKSAAQDNKDAKDFLKTIGK